MTLLLSLLAGALIGVAVVVVSLAVAEARHIREQVRLVRQYRNRERIRLSWNRPRPKMPIPPGESWAYFPNARESER